jgi:Na+-driven multidrug efflux pump
MTFRDSPDDRALLEVIRTYLQLVMGRSTPPPASDAIRYALRLAADAVLPMVEGKR